MNILELKNKMDTLHGVNWPGRLHELQKNERVAILKIMEAEEGNAVFNNRLYLPKNSVAEQALLKPDNDGYAIQEGEEEFCRIDEVDDDLWSIAEKVGKEKDTDHVYINRQWKVLFDSEGKLVTYELIKTDIY